MNTILLHVFQWGSQCSSHLRSWHPTVSSEQQTDFSTTPLSVIPSVFYPLSAHSMWKCLFSSLYSSPALFSYPVSPILSRLCSHFPHCMILFSAIHSECTHCQLFFLLCCSPHIFSLNFPSSPFLRLLPLPSHFLSPPLTSPRLPLFTVSNLKLCLLQRWQEKNIRIKEHDCRGCCRHIPLFLWQQYVLRWGTTPQHLSQKQLRGLSSQFWNSLNCFTLRLII